MERMWFYARSGDTARQGPVPEAQVRAFGRSGVLKPDDLVWTSGMAQWVRVAEVPELNEMAAPTPVPAQDARVVWRPSGWMVFVGVMSILGGVFKSLTCVGIVWGVPMIIAGAFALSAKAAMESMGAVDARLVPMLNRIQNFFIWTGVGYLVVLCALLLGGLGMGLLALLAGFR